MDTLIIDGYSLLFRTFDRSSIRDIEVLTRKRMELIEKITRMQAHLPARILMVFDGRQASREFNLPSTKVEILFSTGAQSADLLIEELIRGHPNPSRVRVVTSDRRVTERAQELGAYTRTCTSFISDIEAETRGLQRDIRRVRAKMKPHRVGDYFPDE